jgi:hypothetical protein
MTDVLLAFGTMMHRVRIGIATLLLAAVVVPGAYAQTEDHKFALGGDFLVRVVPAEQTHSRNSFGPLWRFGPSHTGWGWNYGLNWFNTDVDQTVGGLDTRLGTLRVRPIMVGYGYTQMLNTRTALYAKVLGGYAWSSFRVEPAAADVYRDRLGARTLDVTASNTFAVKPEVGVWYDVSGKVGLNVTAGYMIARPNITVSSSLGNDERRIHADMFMLRVGAVYKVF